MKTLVRYVCMLIVLALVFAFGWLFGQANPVSFYDTFGFYPVCKTSSRTKIMAAQAELCRLGCDIGPDGVDGKWGKNSAMAFCELITDLENKARMPKETKNGQKRTSQNHSL